MTRKVLAGALALLALAAVASPVWSQEARETQDSGQDSGLSITPPATSAPAAAQAPAPIEWDKKRLEKLERNVRKLEGDLARLKPDKAPPQLLEPDPELVALQGRVDDLTQRLLDLDATLKRVNAALDQSALDLDTLKKDDGAAHADADALRTRVDALETQVKALTPPPPPPGAAAASSPDAAATAGAPPSADPAQAFASAMKTMRDGDYAAAEKAFQDYLTSWPDGPDAAEAHYRLAETLYVRDDQAGAASEYARALKGFPKAVWAGDALVKLGMALQSRGDDTKACQALAEFGKRYAASAPATVKSRAAALKTKAKCHRA
jgi:tol-pal system protein YbgF